MYQLKTPGVYREDIFSTPEPELLTGVPAFLGFAEKGSINEPQQLTLWPQFVQQFGVPVSDGYLDRAVQGFFRNGGSVCYVLRLDDKDNVAIENALSQGLEALTSLDTIDLICVPDIMRGSPSDRQVCQLQMAVLAHCQEMGDRFAILDCVKDSTVQKVQSQAQNLGSQGHNGALYFPWVKIENGPQNTGGYVPPCGHIAGVYALSDREVGVHNAPANYPLAGVLDLRLNLSNTDQQAIKSVETMSAVNCLRGLPGRGIRIWGARTLSQQAQWRYINVQRLFLTVGRWVERNLAEVAFEPNDFSLWIRIERELTGYLASLLQQGALKGRTPPEAFYVKCDRETNPPEMRDAGVVVTEIGLAPTIPNEFIIVRLIHGSTGVSLA